MDDDFIVSVPEHCPLTLLYQVSPLQTLHYDFQDGRGMTLFYHICYDSPVRMHCQFCQPEVLLLSFVHLLLQT